MIYQVRANLYFTDQDAILDIRDKILDHWDKAQVVNPGQPGQEISVIEIIENHHDEDPNGPCNQLFFKDNSPD